MQSERHKSILNLLADTGFVNVVDLAGRFGVTTETIRRDLEKLEQDGLVKKVRGGAVSTQPRMQTEQAPMFESAYILRKEEHADEKAAIAAVAADMIDDGDTVILSQGTTSLAVAAMMHNKKDVTVITNSLPVAMELADCDGISIFLLGGFLRSEDYSVASNTSMDNLEMFNAGKIIAGIGGISIENGLTDYRMDESSLLRRLIDKADTVIGVADHSKFGKVLRYNICPASKFDCIITTSKTPEHQYAPFMKAGVKIVIAGEK